MSLGTNCFSRGYFTALGLKPRKQHGELTMPFDVCRHSIDGIIKTLDENFEHYFDGISVGVATEYEKQDSKGDIKTFINKEIGARYVHDHWITKEELGTRYKNRIENFKKCITSGKHIFFALTQYEGINVLLEHIKKLEVILDKFCKSLHSLIILCTKSAIDYSSDTTLVLDEKFHIEGSWPFILETKGLATFQNITKEVKNFIDRRLAETELSERKAEVVSVHNITDGDKLTE